MLVGQSAEFIVSEVAILKFLARKLPKWQAPERSCSFDALPPTAADARVALDHGVLDFDSATHGVHHGAELDQRPVAGNAQKISYAGYRFPPEVIHQAIWLYLRFTLSFRDVEDLLAERGSMVSYQTVRRWVNYFGPIVAADLRKRRPKPHST